MLGGNTGDFPFQVGHSVLRRSAGPPGPRPGVVLIELYRLQGCIENRLSCIDGPQKISRFPYRISFFPSRLLSQKQSKPPNVWYPEAIAIAQPSNTRAKIATEPVIGFASCTAVEPDSRADELS